MNVIEVFIISANEVMSILMFSTVTISIIFLIYFLSNSQENSNSEEDFSDLNPSEKINDLYDQNDFDLD